MGSDAAGSDADATMPLGPWGPPMKIPQASTGLAEDDVTLSSNTLEMFFAIAQADGTKDLYYSYRTSTGTPWTNAVPVPFNSGASDETPRLSTDDKTLYFASGRASGNGTLDIFQVTRAAAGATTWGPATPVPGVNSAVTEKWYTPCGTRYMMVKSNGANGTDVVEGPLGGQPSFVAELSSPQSETGTFLTPDCLTIYFASGRSGKTLIYTSHRNDLASLWQPPTPINYFAITGGQQQDPWMSIDQRTFAFASDAAGNNDIYISTR